MIDNNKTHTFIIPAHCAGERLDQALTKFLPHYSRTQIQAWIEDGAILLNGKAVKTRTKLKGGETVTAQLTLKSQPSFPAENIPLAIVYEDEALLIINKPVGLVVHPGAGNSHHTLLNALLHHCPALANLPRAGIVHRLDKETSGLLVIAKTFPALKSLTQQIKKRTMQREYQAIVRGRIISGATISAPIARHPLKRKRMAVIETGKAAITHYRVIEKYPFHTRLKIKLETGRTHQIRVHLAAIHHPIVGDQTYGGRLQLAKGMSQELIATLRQFKHQALHAYALGIEHPVTHELMRWEVELPRDMQDLIQLLRTERK